MRNASEEEQIKAEIEKQEWLRQAILNYDADSSANNTCLLYTSPSPRD